MKFQFSFKQMVTVLTILLCEILSVVSYADVSVSTNAGTLLAGQKVYAFTKTGSYTGLNAITDDTGLALFDPNDFEEDLYRFRADYLGNQFWTDFVTQPDSEPVQLLISEQTIAVNVSISSGPLSGAKVYLFTESGAYLSKYLLTDSNGNVSFNLPVGKTYKFRADYLGCQYWSEPIIVPETNPTTVSVSCGGGLLRIHLATDSEELEGIKIYLFNTNNTYLGLYQISDASGLGSFNVSEGTYKVRADYRGYQFWSNDIHVIENVNSDFIIPHQDVSVTINKLFQGIIKPCENIKVYLFSPTNQYLSKYQTTDTNGQIFLNLPEMSYKVRADYMDQQFWSEEFTWQNTTVNIPMSKAVITVTGGSQPIEGATVYVFSASGIYLNVNGTTDAEGKIDFRLPSGSYLFRYDHLSNQYWSDEIRLEADQIYPIEISTGGGNLSFTLLKEVGVPIENVKCYLFNSEGQYLGYHDITDNSGTISFGLAEGDYKIRIDYLGYQFWTDEYHLKGNITDEKIIPHGDVTITAEKLYATAEPLENVKVYLFKPDNQYMGKYELTDSAGNVTFSLPNELYKVKIDYMAQQYWAQDFKWENITVTINHALSEILTLQSGSFMANIKVYLFSESGTYLSQYGSTNAAGKASFIIPQGNYKFRADYDGEQYWTSPRTITHGETTSTLVELSPNPAVIISCDPEIIAPKGLSVLTWLSANSDSCIIVPDIGEVPLNGSIAISPSETTTYTITAKRAEDSVSKTATVTVTLPSPVLTTIEINPSNISMTTEETQQFTATGFDEFGNEMPVNVVWSTSDSRNSEISRDGIFRPFTTGRFTVTAQEGNVTGISDIIVNEAFQLSTITITPSNPTINVDETIFFTATGYDINGNTVLIGDVIWSTSQPEATIIDPRGAFRSYVSGIITVAGTSGEVTGTTTVNVRSPYDLANIVVTPSNQLIALGEELQFSATGFDHFGNEKATSILWSVSDPENCAITTQGIFTSTSIGNYTITASSEGVTGTSAITVYEPVVSEIMVNPSSITISPGSSQQFEASGVDQMGNPIAVSVNWSASEGGNIDSIGIFSADIAGTYNIAAEYNGVSGAASVLVEEGALNIHISSPTLVEPIERPDIMVQGFIEGIGNMTEFGVTVNGIPAIIYGNEYVVNHVQMQDGENTISAVVTDINGNTKTESIFVDNASTGNYITIDSNFESGLDQLGTTLTINGEFTSPFDITESEITYTGPGTIEFIESSAEKYEIIINGTGVYFITASVVGTGPEDGEVTYEDTVAVEVLEKSVIDEKLKEKWNGMKTALSNINIEGSIKYFTESSREKFHEAFSAISASLPQIASEMADVEMIYCKNWTTKYRIVRHQLIEGEYRDITYYIYFVADNDGIWKISQF